MTSKQLLKCPLCDLEGDEHSSHLHSPARKEYVAYFDCDNCGCFVTTPHYDRLFGPLDVLDKALLSWYTFRNSSKGHPIELFKDAADRVIDGETLPRPVEQAERLLLWLGDTLRVPGREIEHLVLSVLPARFGCVGVSGTELIFRHLASSNFITAEFLNEPHIIHTSITMQGWIEYDRLSHKRIDSKRAFMAMPFGNDKVRRVFNECFKIAVRRAGFELQIVSEFSTTGLIDNHISVGIMRSTFIIADLTDANNGAYWESGLAEGLGKPVFYTCQQQYFDANKTHFDTNHHVTTFWDLDNLKKAEDELTDRIRRTFPDQAQMEDS